MQLVLVTGGKRDHVYKVKVEKFKTKKLAEVYCVSVNVRNGSKYWYHAEIINPSCFFELGECELIRREEYDGEVYAAETLSEILDECV